MESKVLLTSMESGLPQTTCLKQLKAGKKQKTSVTVHRSKPHPPPVVGEEFGAWRVLSSELLRKGHNSYVYVTDGYATCWVNLHNLRAGKSTKSKKFPRKSEHRSWVGARFNAIRNRCNNPKDKNYPNYGGRGIECRFTDRDEFEEYVKTLPNFDRAMQLDRICNEGHYERNNLRWVPAKLNSRNKRTNVEITYEGIKYCAKDFSKFCQIGGAFVRRLIHENHTPECIIAMEPGCKSQGGKGVRYCRCGATPQIYRTRRKGEDIVT